jgi:hypothetical protein
MKWKRIGLHIENLLPGLVTCTLILVMLPESSISSANSLAKTLLANTLIASGLFLAASYLVGVLIVAASRLIIDPVASIFPRPLLFRLYYPEQFSTLGPSEVTREYRKATQTALKSTNEYKRKEVTQRRERARLFRTSIFPICLFVWLESQELATGWRVSLILAAVLLGLILYSYLELAIYSEAGSKAREQARK